MGFLQILLLTALSLGCESAYHFTFCLFTLHQLPVGTMLTFLLLPSQANTVHCAAAAVTLT